MPVSMRECTTPSFGLAVRTIHDCLSLCIPYTLIETTKTLHSAAESVTSHSSINSITQKKKKKKKM